MDQAAPSLEEIRRRIDSIDAELLRLVEERAGLAGGVAAAKRAAGHGDAFGLRPAREAQLMRRLLDTSRQGAGAALTVRLWRELISDSLSKQGPFHLAAWGGSDAPRILEMARQRFGAAPPLRLVDKPEEALAAAKILGGVGVLSLAPDSAWWGRMLVEPSLRVFAALPCLSAWGPTGALAVAAIEVEPSGDDDTFWVTDAPGSPERIEEALAQDGVAGEMMLQYGGLRLFRLAGFYQKEDQRLARAPGRLTGVIGAAARPFDL